MYNLFALMYWITNRTICGKRIAITTATVFSVSQSEFAEVTHVTGQGDGVIMEEDTSTGMLPEDEPGEFSI